MTAIEREVIFKPGARFFREDEAVLFVYCVDASTSIGPRPATKADKENHKGAWESYLAALGSGPLDGDGDGDDGGSLPTEPKPRGRPRKVKPHESVEPRPTRV